MIDCRTYVITKCWETSSNNSNWWFYSAPSKRVYIKRNLELNFFFLIIILSGVCTKETPSVVLLFDYNPTVKNFRLGSSRITSRPWHIYSLEHQVIWTNICEIRVCRDWNRLRERVKGAGMVPHGQVPVIIQKKIIIFSLDIQKLPID